MNTRSRFAIVICCLLAVVFVSPVVRAQYEWDGSEGDDLWSTANNWTNGAAPPTTYNGEVIFSVTDIGNNNLLGGDRIISGTSGSSSFGLHTDDRLTWSSPAGKEAEIHYNGVYTVVRIPPPAGTMILLR